MKKVNKIFFALATFFLMTQSVFGSSVKIDLLGDEENRKVYKFINGNRTEMMDIKISDDEVYKGFCIDVGASLNSTSPFPVYSGGLAAYINKGINNTEKSKEVAKKINEYVHFGYGYNNQTDFKYYLATQKLIWDELYNAGYRTGHYSTDTYFWSAAGTIDVSSEINTIKAHINNHYKKPSFCSDELELELAVGETITYEDTQKVLSNYKVNCSEGITCNIEGNNLTITANKSAEKHTIKFTKEAQGKNANVYTDGSQQAVVTNQGKVEGLSCEFGLSTYEVVQTADARIAFVILLGTISLAIAYIANIQKKQFNA